VNLIEVLRAGLADVPMPQRPAGIEIRQELAPAAGAPVSPPSYEAPLEIHGRHIDGAVRDVIELDSVGSSANRIEEALLDEYREGRYPLPVTTTTIEVAGETFIISTLESPHRIFDAWHRLAAAPGSDVSFERSEQGRALTLAHPAALDPILEASTHDLLFGVWDSHRAGPLGQVRVARSFTSTVIGLDPVPVRLVAARMDPLNLGDAKEVKAPGGRKLSAQGLSSIPPQRRRPSVSISAARFVGFLSFASLRRLRFASYDNVDARILLAALCLHGLLLRESAGWSLRSGCDLVPTGDLEFDVARSGSVEPERFALGLDETQALLDVAVAKLGIRNRSAHLVGGPYLTPLVERALVPESA
jgi:CRISPR-associated protein Csb1